MRAKRNVATLIARLGSADDAEAAEAEDYLIDEGASAVEPLVDATRSPDPRVRFRAVWALGKIGDLRGVEAVIQLTHDEDEQVSYDAIMALGKFPSAEVIPNLLNWLRQPNTESSLPSAAGTALIEIGEPALPHLVPLVGNPSAEVRERALQIIDQINNA